MLIKTRISMYICIKRYTYNICVRACVSAERKQHFYVYGQEAAGRCTL